MNTPGEKYVDSHAECSRCLFRRRQESWSQAGNGQTQVGKQAGESKLGLKAITGSHRVLEKGLVESKKQYLIKAQTK
jgi:hypothetical protein